MSLVYLVSDYSATGEGRTVSVMITPIYSKEGEARKIYIKDTFEGQFGDWFGLGVEELSKHEFEERYLWIMPEFVYTLISEDQPPGFHWFSQVHFNFS